MKRLSTFEKLPPSYLFPEIEKRKRAYLEKNPEADIISLGIGDTVLPLSPSIASAMERAARELGTEKGYSGYAKEQGLFPLREALSSKLYQGKITPDEIYISDGAKCDIGRLQILFSHAQSVGLQDPAYPVYWEGSILQGIQSLHLLPCTPENAFFPDLPPGLDLLYICNPNNPTGVAYTRDQLKSLVQYALKNGTVIIYDGAYSSYIQDPLLPQSIYEIEGASAVAVEVNSFSKMVGFSGVRLGWTVVPQELKFACGSPVWKDWHRLSCTIFNGASNIAQKGGLAVFEEGEWQGNLLYYMENARLLKEAFEGLGYSVYGGVHAPYLWVHTPGKASWDVFEDFLEKKQIVITPGVGYGPSGEHFIRISSFGHRYQIKNVINRIKY
ncbi:MAG: LL-diaminopimelate aminotransferase [Simkaniaceae bacterium]